MKNQKLSLKALNRQNKIKKIALECFLKKGYLNTSLSEIIQKSGGSFSSIYEYFKNKEGLFLSIVSDEIAKDYELFKQLMKTKEKTNLKDFLLYFSKQFLAIFNKSTTLALERVMYSQIYNLEESILKWLKQNKDFFAESFLVERLKKEEDLYVKNNAQKLADLYCSMLKQPLYLNIFTNTLMSVNEQNEHIDFCVEFFIKKLKN